MGLFSSLFGGNKSQTEKSTMQKMDVALDKKKIEAMVSLAEDSLLMRGRNSSINIETTVFAYAGNAYLSHQMILNVNKRTPVSLDIEAIIGMIKESASETDRMYAVGKLMEFLEVSNGQETAQKLCKYIKSVNFRDANLLQLVATYDEKVDIEHATAYKKEIFNKIKEKLVYLGDSVRETGDTLEIDIMFKGFK